MPKRTISLLTDYGLKSPFVGILKGVIYDLNPEVNIVDLTHDVAPYNVLEAAFLLDMSFRYLPPRTIHLVVVDPGVGSSRKPILAVGDRAYYIAPDNGVLSYIYTSDSVTSVYEITADHYFLRPISNTFHGRDIFAPVAAALSMGVESSSFGDKVEKPVVLDVPKPRAEGSNMLGHVLHIDSFGNLITNIQTSVIQGVIEKYGLKGFVAAVGQAKTSRHVDHYAAAEKDVLCSLFGSSGYLEICIRENNAAAKIGASVGTPVTVGFYK